jgi:hypothetical protein
MFSTAAAGEATVLPGPEAMNTVGGDGTRIKASGSSSDNGSCRPPATSSSDGPLTGDHHYYVRQFQDMKGSVNLDAISRSGFVSYAAICGRTLTRAHAKTGDTIMIAGYLGRGTQFDTAIATFGVRYADQTRIDHAEVVAAVDAGRITATTGP